MSHTVNAGTFVASGRPMPIEDTPARRRRTHPAHAIRFRHLAQLRAHAELPVGQASGKHQHDHHQHDPQQYDAVR